jgi:hypothetical protein
MRIAGHERHAFDLRLSDHHPIERVGVNVRKARGRKRMILGYRQAVKSKISEPGRHIESGLERERKLAFRMF